MYTLYVQNLDTIHVIMEDPTSLHGNFSEHSDLGGLRTKTQAFAYPSRLQLKTSEGAGAYEF
jgi:hypothetical protein